MRVYIEGYAATGENGLASAFADVDADTFEDACERLLLDPLYIDLMSKRGTKYYYWGCQLFDNLEDARKSFG